MRIHALVEHRDPEDECAIVDRCLVTMSHFGGAVTRVIGDEIMAVFGAPLAHGDDAERALRAAGPTRARCSWPLWGPGPLGCSR